MAGGAAAAWPFRHSQAPPLQTLAVEQPEAFAPFSLPQDLTLQVNPQNGNSPAPDLLPSAGQPGALARPASFSTPPHNEPPIEALPAPPYLPNAYESLLVPVTPTRHEPQRGNLPVQEPLLPSADDPAAIENEKPSPLWRRHRIVEGDTLSALAERYLGDGARAGEIHVANMDRLASPEILPLGVTLLIPPRIPQSTAQNYQP
jgi:nucleoid-associated protein YgaU